jgi:uncharacterized protein (DUF1330 family)
MEHKMTKAYWIARIDVRDSELYKDYVATAKPAFARYNAKFIARGGAYHAVEGQGRARNVIIEFATMQDALDCYNSPEYQAASAIRQSVADGEIVIVEGNPS